VKEVSNQQLDRTRWSAASDTTDVYTAPNTGTYWHTGIPKHNHIFHTSNAINAQNTDLLLLLYGTPGRFIERRLTNLALYCIVKDILNVMQIIVRAQC